MSSRKCPSLVALTLGLCAVLAGTLGTARAEEGVAVFHHGSTGSAGISWHRDADGLFVPELDGTRTLSETGKPELLVQDLNLLVPLDSDIAGVEIVPLQTHREALPGPMHLGADLVSSEGQRLNIDRLAVGEFFPQNWGEYGGSHVFRGFRMVALRLFPLRLISDPAGGFSGVEVLDRYAVRLIHGDGSAPADIAQRQRLVPGERARAESLVRSMVANPEALIGYQREDGQLVPEPVGGFQPTRTPTMAGSAVNYLIITTSELAPSFEVLATHKTEQGLPALVVTTEWIAANFRNGADLPQTIRMFIRDAYEKWGIEYVLLGGDTDVLPCRFVTSTYYPANGTTDIPVDLYFGALDGNWNADGDYVFGEPFTHIFYPGDDADLAEDVFVGRATVSTIEAATVFVNKVITYSTTPAGSGWTNRNLFAAEVLFPQNWDGVEYIVLDGATFSEGLVNNYIDPCTFMENTRMYEAYDRVDSVGTPLYPGSVPLTRQALVDTLNNGRYGIFNQIGHGFYFNMSVGDANFISADADNLTNGDHLFMLYAVNCASAAFDQSCLLERFLQNPAGGSVASIGSSRAAFPHTSNGYQEIFFDNLYCLGENRLGILMALSRAPFLPETYYNTVHRWTVLCLSLMGDPSMRIWTDVVQPVEVAAPAGLISGTQTVPITVTSGGSPVAGARVCLSKTDDDYEMGITDASGQVELSYTPTEAGDALLTVTGTNIEHTQITIPVTVGSTYVRVSQVQVVDNGAVGSAGNGNLEAEAGETLAIYIVCEDTGGGGAADCNALLGTFTSGVTILDGLVAVGDVPPGGQKTAEEPFLISIDPTVGDGTLATFEVLVNGGAGSYPSETVLTLKAPEPEPVGLEWSDSTFGNSNQTIDSGERIAVTVGLKNFGMGLMDEMTGTLRSLDPEVTLFDTTVTYSNIPLLGLDEGDGDFSFSDANVATESWCWVLFEDNHGRTLRHDFRLVIPSVPDGVESDTSLGPDTIALRWLPLGDIGTRGYNVYRSEMPAGPFEKVNPDLIDGVSYFRDEGLDLLTRYYYRITAVDSSLVEGQPSLTIGRSTAPPELNPFPLPFGIETSSHCAVGDVNGDGMLDVVLGADEVYVWSADGNELFDGDNNAQSHGPITDLSGNFQPAGIALAELDNEPGLEIIASDRNTTNGYAIHIFRWDGTELEGWPQALVDRGLSSWNWPTPAVGDIDGDGDLEIVVNACNSITYAWHVDGTEVRDGDNDPATNGVFLDRNANNEWGLSSPALFDLDDDGAQDIIFGSRYGNGSPNYLFAYRYDGDQVAGFPFDAGLGNVLSSPTVADLNRDGLTEIVFVGHSDSLFVVQSDGSDFPGFPMHMTSTTGYCPSPAVGNFDADDDLEIVAISTELLDLAHIYVVDTDIQGGTSGQALAGWPQSVPGNSEASPVVGDVDGDGVADILHGIGGGHQESPNNLYAFKATGEWLDGFPITLGGPLRSSPVICDLDEDGDVDIVAGAWDLLLHVWDMPYLYDPAKMPWPTWRGHGYRDGVYRPFTLVDVPAAANVSEFVLANPYPNPFNPSTSIRLFMPGEAGVQLPLEVAIFDLRGRQVRSLHSGPANSGWHTWVWDGRDGHGRGQASGIYFLRAQAAEKTVVRKMSLIK